MIASRCARRLRPLGDTSEVSNTRRRGFSQLALLALVLPSLAVLGVLLALPLFAQKRSAEAPGSGEANAPGNPIAQSLAIYDESGFGEGQLHSPRVLAVSPEFLFVADRTSRIFRFRYDAARGDLQFDGSWVLPLSRNGNPAALYWQSDPACLLVGETHYGHISRYSASGELLSQFGRVGNLPGEFQRIQGIAANAHGDLFVTDTFDHTERVQVFDADGVWLRQWGGYGDAPGRFNRPVGIVVTRDSRVCVADAANHRIQIFTESGELLEILAPPSMRYPYDLALDAAGNLYALEFTGSRVLRFALDGQVTAFGAPGRELGQFAQPWGLEALPSGLLWVADTRNDRLVAFKMDAEGKLPLSAVARAEGGR